MMKHAKNLYNNSRMLAVLICLAVSVIVTPLMSGFTLVIDPGHGGKDFGARGKITNEKTINLKVARLLGDKVKENIPEVKVVFTRSDDRFVSLQDRARIANKASGDLFVSIHVNSVDRRNRQRTTINGASVYTLGLHKSADNLEVAKRENSVMVLEDDYNESYEGFNPESSESYIIFELSQNKHFEQSVKLAGEIQHELINTAGRADKGVRQAGFWVLWSTGMPSVLVELDFICNPSQEKFLASSDGQEKMAQAIYNAVSHYVSSNGSMPDRVIRSNPDEIRTIDESDKGKYTVIFLTTSRTLAAGSSELDNIGDVCCFPQGTLRRYCIAPVETKKEAEKKLSEIKARFPNAFVKKL